MIEIRLANQRDAEEEYKVITSLKEDENGFINDFHDVDYVTFISDVLPKMKKSSLGIGLSPGWVAQSYYFVYNDQKAVGLIKFRPELNETLRNGSGHIGYGLIEDARGKGIMSEALALLMREVDIAEDEYYLSCHKNNPASLKVMLKNGGYIEHEDAEKYYVRIPKNETS